jgi:hypothetical protein
VKVEDVLTSFIRRAELARDGEEQRPERFVHRPAGGGARHWS